MSSPKSSKPSLKRPSPGSQVALISSSFPRVTPIWWSNSVFFVVTHLAAFYGVLYASPFSVTSRNSLLLAIVLWQLACFGITLGYHRLYSHRAFHAPIGVRIVLAILGSMAFQGSIKVSQAQIAPYDPVHDPYSATRGLFFSHMGWIFFKPSYTRMESIDKYDLEKDPVVRYQHKNYSTVKFSQFRDGIPSLHSDEVPIAIFFGIVAPVLMGWTWGDPRGAFVWAGLVARVITWHCTFLVNSFAHWEGLQKYTDEVTARGNLTMALWTCGEGNHNFHAFPYDFRAGPSFLDWDPSKWIIQGLHHMGLASRLRRARDQDVEYAMRYMQEKQKKHNTKEARSPDLDIIEVGSWQGPTWDRVKTQQQILARPERTFLVLDDFLLDVTTYMKEHPGGAALLRTCSLRAEKDFVWQDANWAFRNLNYHSNIARKRLRELIVAKVPPS